MRGWSCRVRGKREEGREMKRRDKRVRVENNDFCILIQHVNFKPSQLCIFLSDMFICVTNQIPVNLTHQKFETKTSFNNLKTCLVHRILHLKNENSDFNTEWER